MTGIRRAHPGPGVRLTPARGHGPCPGARIPLRHRAGSCGRGGLRQHVLQNRAEAGDVEFRKAVLDRWTYGALLSPAGRRTLTEGESVENASPVFTLVIGCPRPQDGTNSGHPYLMPSGKNAVKSS